MFFSNNSLIILHNEKINQKAKSHDKVRKHDRTLCQLVVNQAYVGFQ